MNDQKMKCINRLDADGNPAGGNAYAYGMDIWWQNGPLGAPDDPERQEPNGAFVETVIRAARQRIAYYQIASDGRFNCRENAEAIVALGIALDALDRRTQRRTEAGTEGTHEQDT